VAGVGGVMATQVLGGPGSRFVASAQALTPYGLPLAVVVAGGALWRRSHALAAAASMVGAAVAVLALPVVFPSQPPPALAGARGMRAASVNLLYDNESVDEAADDLLVVDADVVLFTEYTPEHAKSLLDHRLSDRYPHQINRDAPFASGIAIWSKFELEEPEPPSVDGSGRWVSTVVRGPDRPLRVLGVHPPTPIYDHDEWASDLRALGTAVSETVLPTLVIGDFNASYWHPRFREILDRGFVDAHIANGDGWSTSWPTDRVIPPFVRLDHALTGNGLVATDVDDFRVAGSDHVGFVVTVTPSAE
jgi:endonuclease/exonuclease/phosphatase (EEP) superfamily protein YafD